jgi:hypothetical protein
MDRLASDGMNATEVATRQIWQRPELVSLDIADWTASGGANEPDAGGMDNS